MKKKMVSVLCLIMLCGAVPVVAEQEQDLDEQGSPEITTQEVESRDGRWHAAAGEFGEAATAVGVAIADSAKELWCATKRGTTKAVAATKEDSDGVWQDTKDKTRSLWRQGKSLIHEATAPQVSPPAETGLEVEE